MGNETFLPFQIRNGLGRFEMPKRNFLHSFDAFGKLSSWKFTGNGSAYFSTRYIATYGVLCGRHFMPPLDLYHF